MVQKPVYVCNGDACTMKVTIVCPQKTQTWKVSDAHTTWEHSAACGAKKIGTVKALVNDPDVRDMILSFASRHRRHG